MQRLLQGFRSSFCISLTTLPVLLSVFYEWNLLSILLNVLVIPLMGILMGGTALLVLAGSVVGGIGEPFFVFLRILALPVKGILIFYEKLCLLSEGLPAAQSVISLTGYDEENLLLSLFAMKHSDAAFKRAFELSIVV